MGHWEVLSARITESFGLMPRGNWMELLEQATADVAQRYRCEPAELLQRLDADTTLLHELAGMLTVGETHFMRHPEHFDALIDVVSAALGRGEEPLLWSAGCASGEEPYSMAIVIEARLGAAALSHCHILATDISAAALDKARTATYSPWSFRGTPAWIHERYFERADDRLSRLAPSIRNAVQFERATLSAVAERTSRAAVHAIFFRNVAIYLSPTNLARLYGEFRRILRPDGILATALTDPRPDASLFSDADGAPVLRPSLEAHAPAATPPASARVSQRRTAPRRRAPSASQAPRQSKPSSPRAALPPATPHALRRGALERGDAGDLASALRIATQQVEGQPTSAEARELLGQLLLAGGRVDEAVLELRRAVYLDAERLLARYWYATALQASGATRQARTQLAELADRLGALPADTALAEAQDTVGALLETVLIQLEATT